MMPPGAPRPEDYTEGERRNLAVVREYMEVSYDAKRASADAVRHLVAADASFEAKTTFLDAHDPLAYAQAHSGAARCMNEVASLRPPWLSGCAQS